MNHDVEPLKESFNPIRKKRYKKICLLKEISRGWPRLYIQLADICLPTVRNYLSSLRTSSVISILGFT